MTSGLEAFTVFHVVVSLIGIVAGLVVLFGMISGKRLDLMDWPFFADDGSHQCDRLLFPLSRRHARNCGRHPVAHSARRRDCWALSPPPGRRVA